MLSSPSMENKRYSSEITARFRIAVEQYLLDLTTWLLESPGPLLVSFAYSRAVCDSGYAHFTSAFSTLKRPAPQLRALTKVSSIGLAVAASALEARERPWTSIHSVSHATN